MSVPGEGRVPCARMAVGEAPGRTEEKQGRPFVGPAGEWLESLFTSFGLARDDVYITNVCKELPLDDEGKIRAPFPAECERWEPILWMEFEAVQPEAVLVLGRTAYNVLQGDWSSPPSWGEPWRNKDDVLFVPVWHPAYILRQSSLFEPWREQAKPWAEAVK